DAAVIWPPLERLICGAETVSRVGTMLPGASTRAEFLIENSPPFESVMALVPLTTTLPVCPEDPEKASLKMPVGMWVLPWLSMMMLAVITATVPASAKEKVLESIEPPLTTDRLPAAILIVPAFPLPELASLKMPVRRWVLPWLSMMMLPALTVMVP